MRPWTGELRARGLPSVPPPPACPSPRHPAIARSTSASVRADTRATHSVSRNRHSASIAAVVANWAGSGPPFVAAMTPSMNCVPPVAAASRQAPPGVGPRSPPWGTAPTARAKIHSFAARPGSVSPGRCRHRPGAARGSGRSRRPRRRPSPPRSPTGSGSASSAPRAERGQGAGAARAARRPRSALRPGRSRWEA